MDETENEGVTEQLAAETAVPDQPHDQQTETTPQPAEDRPEINWKREMDRKEQRWLKEMEKRDELLKQLVASVQPKVKEEIDELDQLSDDEYIPKGKQKKLVKMEVAHLEKKIEELEQRIQAQKQDQWKENLERKFSDFSDVVNRETLALLEETEPELAETIAALKDPYLIGMQSYKFIKSSGLMNKIPQARRAREVEKKIEQSAKTVQTPQAFDKRPMAQAYLSTEIDKTKLYEEMMNYSRLAGGY